MNRIIIITALSVISIFIATLGFAQAATDPFQKVCSSGSASGSTVCTSRTSSNPLVGPDGLFGKITKAVAFAAGVVAILIIMYGGFSYITSAGDSSKINTAKNTIMYAIVGIIVIITAQTIIVFVINRL